jgi:hypothetical protein
MWGKPAPAVLALARAVDHDLGRFEPDRRGADGAHGFGLLMDAIAYTLLQNELLAVNGKDSAFAHAVKSDLKGKISPVLYVAAIGLAFSPVISRT